MSDLHRGTRWYDVRLTGREVSGIVTGALVMLGVAFALGVSVGHRLAAPPPKAFAEVEVADAGLPTPSFTYQQVLTNSDAGPSARPAPPPKPAPIVAAPKPTPPPEAPKPSLATTEPPANEEAAFPAEHVPDDPADDQFTVQFASFPNAGQAARLAETLHSLNYDAYVQVATLPHKGKVYRVRVGHFRSHDSAERVRKQALTAHHLDAAVMPSH